MINFMTCSEYELRAYGVPFESDCEYEICSFSNKNCYSYSQAHQKMRNLKHCRTRNRNKVYLRAYKCKRCHSWHLTSEPPFQVREEHRTAYEKKLVG